MTRNEIIAQMVAERPTLYDPSMHLPDLITTISPNESMSKGNVERYFNAGYSALNAIDISLLAAGKKRGEIENILDFPCGYGRVLRAIKAAFPAAKLSACDVDRGAVDFCNKTFNAEPIYSSYKIESIKIKKKFDLIWVGSLFTHLDSGDWDKFMKLFSSILNSGGILVVTVEGKYAYRLIEIGEFEGLDAPGAKKLLKSYKKKGFGYANYKEEILSSVFKDIIDKNKRKKYKYGRSVVKRSWATLFLERFPDFKQLTYTERGWARCQDVISLQKITPI